MRDLGIRLKKIVVAVVLLASMGVQVDAAALQNPAAQWSDETNIELSTPMGKMIGRQHSNIRIFRGIPYAKADRFSPPVKAEPWDGVRDFTKYGKMPPQYGKGDFSEDSLTLNIWAPETKTEEKLPVYVFIHGGGFAFGGGSRDLYESTHIAEKGIVAVTINYRLNALGFLANQTTYNKYKTTGNWGLLDQIEALKWIKNNITAFGGDPNRVTVGGESAGAFSVSALITSPLAKGLFNQGIMESGTILNVVGSAPISKGDLGNSIETGKQYAKLMGGDDTVDGINYLRNLPAQDLANTSPCIIGDSTNPQPYCFWPVYDGYVLPKNPVDEVKKGNINNVNLLIGFNTNEGTIFSLPNTTEQDYHATMYKVFGKNAAEVLAKYPVDESHDAFARNAQIYGPAMLYSGSVYYADALSKAGKDVYMYRYDYKDPNLSSENRWGAFHSAEMKYIFQNNMQAVESYPEAKKMSEQMLNMWANFIKTGNPNSDGTIEGNSWEKYNHENRKDFRIGTTSNMEPLYEEELIDFVNEKLHDKGK